MDTKKHYKLYKDGKKWCVMTIAAVASVIGLATTANADDTDTTTSLVQTAQVADNSNVAELPQSNVESVQANSNPANQDIENENLNSSVISDDKSTTPVQPQSAQEKNGWVNENNNWTYYNNGQVTNGRDYTYLPTINGGGHSWYLVDNGVVQSGVQQWAGSYYDFDANNNYQRVDNNYVQSQWGDWYLFGNDGRIQTGVQQWAGTYYYFDPTTYLRVDNDYRQAQWGD
ncbi:KxYKxGKxW signal peptide domain-containing protein, partial [Limosilactobacillus reuteri]